MAERRMFAKSIVDSDLFLEMPMPSQLLYFHLAMRADDDGFVNSPKKIMRFVGASIADMNALITNQFIIPFESGVIVIKHWKIHNYIQKDRYKPTSYQAEKESLTLKNDIYFSYNLPDVSILDTNCIQDVSILDTQVRLGKDNIGKNKHICSKSVSSDTVYEERFNRFWGAYPKKVGKQAAKKAFIKIKPNDELLAEMLNAIENQKQSEQWKRDNGQFIPYPATWLNGRRWEDEINASDDNPPDRFSNPEYYKDFKL